MQHRLQLTCPPNSNTCEVKHSSADPAWQPIVLETSQVTRAADGTVVIDVRIDDANWPPKSS